MREKYRGKPPMVTADHMRAKARQPLAELVEHFIGSGLTRMEAYAKAASMLVRRPAWVQRVIGRRGQVTVAAHDWENLTSAYRRLCARIEAAAERVEAENNQLREAIDAALSARAAPEERATRSASPRAAAARRPGPPAAPSLVGPGARPAVPTDRPPLGVKDLPLWRAIEGE